MSRYKATRASLPTDDESIDSRFMRRQVKGLWERFQDSMTSPDMVMIIMLISAGAMVIAPWTFILTGLLATSYYAWASSRKYKLPFKIPINWGGTDYGSPKPGQPGKFAKASGILYFGRDDESLEELWIENGDARRHGFFIGTTGSGKALPLDSLILTPEGWMKNQDIAPGMDVCHPDGGISKVVSIHRQGVIPSVRLHFSDGRVADCSLDHLWHVKARPKPGSKAPVDIPEEGRIMEASDLGILHGLYSSSMELCVPRPLPHTGPAPRDGQLGMDHARLAARDGFQALDYMPSVIGSDRERRNFLADYLRAKSATSVITDYGLRVCGLDDGDAVRIKQIAWSLGGVATTFITVKGRKDVLFMVDNLTDFHPDAGFCKWPNGMGLEIMEIERLEDDAEMSCIKVDREDGLYVMENHIVTHNTELLLGVVSQTLMWSSGFLFIDGKGTTEFYARSWTLCKRFGREDDLRVLNFTDPGGDPDAPAGGPSTQSNTLNPFAKGSPDQLMNIVVSLMGDAGSGNDMWKSRAVSLVTALMMGLCELRDSGEILLNVQTIRDFLFLGKGFDKENLGGRKIKKIEDVPEEAWEEMKTRAGLIELYLRALKGDLSNATKLAMKGFFDTLPGFSIEKAINGDNQESKANEQYGFLSMQLTKPLGSLADGYGHIFRTPLGEIDMDDVVLNRRILVVLLPALQKAPDEMQNCGKIVVTMAKIMMGNASGFSLQGTRQEIVEAKQTRAPSPFIVVLDEAGYYMVKGIDVMMAQARSLGFMIIVAGQDMAAMQAIDPQIAETAAANASILAVGKTVDGNKTVQFVQQLMGKATVSVTSGYQARSNVMGGTSWDDRMDASFQEVDKVKLSELQALKEGQFYLLFDGRLCRASTFYIGGDFAENFSVNKFLKVRGPTDRVPGLNQDVEIDFLDGYVKVVRKLADGLKMGEVADNPLDSFTQIKRIKDVALARTKVQTSDKVHTAWLAALMGVVGLEEGEAVISDLDDLDDIDLDDESSDVEEDEMGWNPHEDVKPQMRPQIPRDMPRRMPDFEDDEAMVDRERFHRSRADLGRRIVPPRERPTAIKEAPETVTATVSEGLNKATSSETVRARHGALVGLLAQEKKAVEEARSSGAITDLDVNIPDASKHTIGSMFSAMAKQMSKMERLLVSELAEGNVGAEIMQRAISINPMPLPGTEAEEYIQSRLSSLEEQFGEE
ncbi:TraM recognition domain-containing protein [Pseudosulfitobacter pseudonitzschiae]|uniref:type IV secretory system conjugative DNA transfer family protein n=1 Tax=Pseudosulfitobacter pseudonitzschiae TaxID=1402135 RepID=UPI003B76672B